MSDREASVEVGHIIGDLRARMLTSEGLMFNGVPLSDEDVSKLVDAIELSTAIVLGKKSQ